MPMLAASTTKTTVAPADAGTRTLVTHCADAGAGGHDRESRANVARRLAQVMHWRYGGAYDASLRYEKPLYVVPHDALLTAQAAAVGVHGADQLFGGVVPHAFVATKAITHPLVSRDAVAPEGWSHACGENMHDAALRGYTAFDRRDAREAATALLRHGPVRIKSVTGIGGAGQHLVRQAGGIDPALEAVGDDAIAYCGTQCTTVNRNGHEVYGGSTLDVVRGRFDDLLAAGLEQERYKAVVLAQAYDAAAFAAYPSAYASRRNYDVLFGRDASGRLRSGVLEQSWRIGGASGAEVMALDAFLRDHARTRVRCATVETYDDACVVPDGAFVYYRGVDAHAGPLTKYAIELDGHDA